MEESHLFFLLADQRQSVLATKEERRRQRQAAAAEAVPASLGAQLVVQPAAPAAAACAPALALAEGWLDAVCGAAYLGGAPSTPGEQRKSARTGELTHRVDAAGARPLAPAAPLLAAGDPSPPCLEALQILPPLTAAALVLDALACGTPDVPVLLQQRGFAELREGSPLLAEAAAEAPRWGKPSSMQRSSTTSPCAAQHQRDATEHRNGPHDNPRRRSQR